MWNSKERPRPKLLRGISLHVSPETMQTDTTLVSTRAVDWTYQSTTKLR